MTPDFVRQHAPNLFIPMDDGGAGLDTEQPMYDRVTGMPSPWLREGNAPRQYFGDPQLRGLQEPDFPMAPPADTITAGATPGITGPTNTSPPPGFQGYDELIVRPNDLRGLSTDEVPPDQDIYGGSAPRDVLRTQRGVRANGPMGQSGTVRIPQGPGNVAGYDSPALTGAERAMRSPQGTTLQDVLARFNFQIPTFDASMIPSFLSESRDGRLRGRSTENTIDNRGDTGTVQNVSQSVMPDFSTPQGLADFNQRTGLALRNQVRTQAEQDSLYERGLTPTRDSYHVGGRALDMPRRYLSGRTGREAENYTREIFRNGGYDPDQFEFRWESGRGRNQGTGPHVHVEPRN